MLGRVRWRGRLQADTGTARYAADRERVSAPVYRKPASDDHYKAGSAIDTATLQAMVVQALHTGAKAGRLLTASGVAPLVDVLVPPKADDTNRGGRRALRAEEALRTAIAAIGGDPAEVLLILFELAPGTVNKSLGERRTEAANFLDLQVETFMSDRHEKAYIRLLVVEILRMVLARGIPA